MKQGLKKTSTVMLATDRLGSVLQLHKPQEQHPYPYTVFGFDPFNGTTRLLGFTGAHREKNGAYLLGNGYRGYNSELMRFNSPDSWSPFARGGLNTYAYCQGDPINMTDRSGHAPNIPGRVNTAWKIDKSTGWRALLLNNKVVDKIINNLPATEVRNFKSIADKTQLAATRSSNKAAFNSITTDNYMNIRDAINEGTLDINGVSLESAENRIDELHIQHLKSLWGDDDSLPRGRDGRRRAIGRATVEHREDSLDRLAAHNESVQRIRDQRDNP
jgi:RHS repeat-associated protein